MQCPNCAAENPDDKRFCGECGTQLYDSTDVSGARRGYFVQYRWLGRTNSFTREGWTARIIIFLIAAGALAAIWGTTLSPLLGIALFGFFVLLVVISYGFAKKYQKVGRPLGPVGEVPSDEPGAREEVEKWTR